MSAFCVIMDKILFHFKVAVCYSRYLKTVSVSHIKINTLATIVLLIVAGVFFCFYITSVKLILLSAA